MINLIAGFIAIPAALTAFALYPTLQTIGIIVAIVIVMGSIRV